MLAGQTEPYEAFTNPLWVGLFAVLGRFNVSGVQVQVALGVILYALLAALLFRALSERFRPPSQLSSCWPWGRRPSLRLREMAAMSCCWRSCPCGQRFELPRNRARHTRSPC